MNEQGTMMNQQQQHQQQQQQQQLMNKNSMSMNQINPHQQQPQMVPMTRGYGMWSQPPPQFRNPNPGAMKPSSSGFNKPLGPRSNWKGKKVNKPHEKRRKELQKMAGPSTGGMGGGNEFCGAGVGNLNYDSYKPPNLNELQHQNRLKMRKFFPKKKFNKNNNMNMGVGNSRSAPYAPRNTTSFLIRAKKSGGIASMVSPCPVTPPVLPTPMFSPSKEVLVDMAKEEWGVDGYGSMNGLIRLRSPGHEMEGHEDEEEDEGGSSESDVEEHAEVERRLDHDLSRFEMIYDPNSVSAGGLEYQSVLGNRVDDQDTHIAHLEEENLILKERLFLMERELGDLRRRMQFLERKGNGVEDMNEEIVENESENESESRGKEAQSMEYNNKDSGEENVRSDNYPAHNFEAAATTGKILELDTEGKGFDETDKSNNTLDVEKESQNDSVVSIEANNSKNIEVDADRKEDDDGCHKFVIEEVKVEDNADDKSIERVMVGDVCMEGGVVAKDGYGEGCRIATES